MTQEVKRNYLEINSLEDLKQGSKPSDDYSLNLLDPVNFQLNKFFYKNIGNKHKWVDRLTWTEEKWIDYVSSKNVKTYVLKCKDDLVGFFELIFHSENNETEIAYFGILEEYQNKKLGSFFWKSGDQKTIDRYGPDGISQLIKTISYKASKFQTGYLFDYAFVMLLGFSLLLTFLIIR